MPRISDLNDQDALKIANQMMDDLMNASTQKDYAGHILHFSKRAQSMLDETRFEVICEVYQKKMGFFQDRTFVALFRRPDSIAFVWQQTYSKAKGEFVAEMVMIVEDDEYKVDHAFVF